MQQPNRVIFWCLVLSTALLANSFPSSIAYDRAIHAIVFLFFATGSILLVSRRSLPGIYINGEASQKEAYSPLEQLPAFQLDEDISNDEQTHVNILQSRRTRSRVILLMASLMLILRIEFLRRILKATECTISSLEVFIPFILSLYDTFRFQMPRSHGYDGFGEDDLHETVYEALHRRYLDSRFRYVYPVFVMSSGAFLASGLWTGVSPTYICPLVVGQTWTVPLMQVICVVLDCCLAIVVLELCLPAPSKGATIRAKTPLVWGSILLAVSTTWLAIGVIVFYLNPQYRNWLVPLELMFDLRHIFAFLWQLLLFASVCICSAHCIIHLGVLELALTLATICIMTPSISFLWVHRHPFPPVSYTSSLGLFLVLGGYFWFQHTHQSFTHSRHMTTFTKVVLFLTFLLLLYPAFSRPNIAHFHPIDMLIYEAESQHDHYASFATQSHNLDEAAAQYRRRYRMTPPPGFDIWYQYSLTRSSLIIDQYDQLYNDLLPFWSIPPEQLRKDSWKLLSNPWNDIGGITIRGGQASVSENVPGTHRWMLEGVVSMINKFAQYLPDMDLAFNLNDEARVAVPYRDIEQLRQAATAVEERPAKQSWSDDRASGWPAIREEPYTQTILEDMAFQNTFLKFGSIGCHPSSPARTTRDLYSHAHLCVSCTAPHSLGQFLSNWTLSADVCHQPDMATLHGFYLSPAAFRDAHVLVPIFSQSKPHGFNDILYPSAWNYVDKVVYSPTERSGDPDSEDFNSGHPDPPFALKQNTLFWRGATSEGVSSGDHTWRGMTRQRLVHLANNLTSSAHDTVTILLPADSSGESRYRYTTVPGNAVENLGLSTDIAIVDSIARCGGIGLYDCKDQEAEFALVKPADFQSHWQYRYLFDLDGAGFSGRFLAFLQSRSLPFKTALFREWYDERMTAWHHFVPIDGRLHGVWSTLAYFAGVNGTLPGGRKVEMKERLKQGERIADQGRQWAGKVLRKDDMEIYFFRLLLEWGRLTDDNRDNMGFVPGGSGAAVG